MHTASVLQRLATPELCENTSKASFNLAMLVLIGILFIALILYAVNLQKRGMAGWKAALLVIFGSGLIVVIMFGLLFVGFQGFDRPPS